MAASHFTNVDRVKYITVWHQVLTAFLKCPSLFGNKDVRRLFFWYDKNIRIQATCKLVWLPVFILSSLSVADVVLLGVSKRFASSSIKHRATLFQTH